MKIKGLIGDLKIKKNNLKIDNNKTIYMTFSGVVVDSLGQFIFIQFLGLACTSQDLQVPSYVVGANYRVLIYCTCHFQRGSLCLFSFFCLLISLVSNFCPDTTGQWWSLFQAHLFSHAVGREEHCKQISLACVGNACRISAALGLPLLTPCVLSWSTLLRLQLALLGSV